MTMRRSLFQWMGILSGLALVVVLAAGAQESKTPVSNAAEKRADIVLIEGLKVFGALERPVVRFLHDKHTEVLEKKNKDCLTCHLTDKDRLSPKFKRLKDENRSQVMDLYHAECLGCHRETVASGDRTGPVEECGKCHRETDRILDSRAPMGMDRSLHYRHSQAAKDKCELCHHEYDEIGKKLFYAKDKEGSCRYCHKHETEQNRSSMRLASHGSCIDCHRKTLEKEKAAALAGKKVAGPVHCSGCHDPVKQAAIEKVKDIPRLKRNQPDVVLLQAEGKEKDNPLPVTSKMDPVPFDHKSHEEYNESCVVCHHASMESCSKYCHTLQGSNLGKDIKLERAMHQIGARESCLGCHQMTANQKNCAGCHAFMERSRELKQSACTQCHMKPAAQAEGTEPKPGVTAGLLLQSRKTLSATGTYRDEDIPEKILIKGLSDKYEPVDFPHRRIVHDLKKRIQENKLADFFHAQEGLLCQGCHHNSPASKKPPLCVSCHGKPFDAKNPLVPGIKAAYHQQCMGCHKEMEIKKPASTACEECHKEKRS